MHELISANKRRSIYLMIGFSMLTGLVGIAAGFYVGNTAIGFVIAMLFSSFMAVTSYWKSDAIALRMSRAQIANETDYRRLHNLVEGLCIASGLPKPGIYIINDQAPNAFATGRNPKHAAIAVTTGLLEKLDRVELEGVLAHELSHIRNYDILVSTMAVTLVGAIAIMTDLAIRMMWWNGGRSSRDNDRGNSSNPLALVGFALLIIAPIVAKIMQATISRRRESLADASACQMTRYPPGLISALEKLQADCTVTHSASMATAHMWIEQPLSGINDSGKLAGFHKLFNTHPPLAERIATLREI